MTIVHGPAPDVSGRDQREAVIASSQLDTLIRLLGADGFEVLGPIVRDGAIVHGALTSRSDLPVGWHDRQEPGQYEVTRADDETAFSWAVGPDSWKPQFLPPSRELWRSRLSAGAVTIESRRDVDRPMAIIGIRPCDLAALRTLDAVLLDGAHRDAYYERRRAGAFIVVVECSAPASTCFCSAMGTGPEAVDGYDLALSELVIGGILQYLIRARSDRGVELIDRLESTDAHDDVRRERARLLAAARDAQCRHIDPAQVARGLAQHQDTPAWDDVAKRCLSCANCTSVCPTCFCCDVDDTSDVHGVVSRRRSWSSCFELDHSYLHGGAVRHSTSSRYRQWATHKFSTWWDQFGTSGCVGCGRCVTWCPVGIDVTTVVNEVSASSEDRPNQGGGETL